MWALIAVLTFVLASSSLAADATITDGDTLKIDGTSYRLDGIDAPEMDQACLDDTGKVWNCGIEARDRLAEFVGKRPVDCQDLGPDKVYPGGRRIGICSVGGVILNQWLVREGWAVDFRPYSRGRFEALQADAERSRRGLWKGCFVAPSALRRWDKTKAKLMGAACASANEASARNTLFPDHAAMPPDCPIKGTISLRAKFTGHIGIYHMAGCRSYRRTTKPNRWFCSENDAKDAEFRKAFTCR